MDPRSDILENTQFRDVYIVDGSRTPFLKAKKGPGPFSAADLAVAACEPLLLRQPFEASALDQVIAGCVIPSADEANIARVISLRLGCGYSVPAWTVQRNCASGLQAIDSAAKDIALGRSDLVLTGGTEAMSRAPLIYNDAMTKWFAKQFFAKTPWQKINNLFKFRPAMLKPIASLVHGLTDHVVDLSMGQTAEELAYRFHITREEMDQFALQSHQRAMQAAKEHHFACVHPMVDVYGQSYQKDDGVREDTTIEVLSRLRPYFDKRFGMVTAGNSAQVTDGAAFLLLASDEAVKKHQLPVIAKIIDIEWSGVDPVVMGLGPVNAMYPILKRQSLHINDIDLWEINEAFAVQVLACRKALASEDYCRQYFGDATYAGEIPMDALNVDGGAIALGHPVGASGARLPLQVLDGLKRQNLKRAMISLCIGGGQGGAMLLERV